MFEIIPILACEPTTIALMAVSAASAGAQYMGAKQQADAEAKHQKAVGADIARQEALQQTQLASNVREKLDASRRQREQFQRKSMTQASRVGAASAEAGIEGSSLELAMQEFDAYDARWMEAQYMKEDTMLAKWDRDKELLASQVQGRLVSNFSPINQPSPLAYGLQAAQGMLGAYDNYQTRTGGAGKTKTNTFKSAYDTSG